LVTNRAIDRVVEEDELENRLSCLDDAVALGLDHHPVGDGRVATWLEFRPTFYLHQTHPAVGGT
jgi:hypothetical protein